jgi:hypothetical protein
VSKTCFVIMPITTPLEARPLYRDDDDHFTHVLDHLFEPALKLAGYAVMRPLVDHSEVIQGEIVKNLNAADLVLCDISQLNANVFFELGIRVALDKPVVMVRDNLTLDIPFDNAIASCYEYNASLAPWRLAAEIEMLQKFVCGVDKQIRNALWKYFGIAQQAAVRQEGDPISAKLDLLLSEMSALRQQQDVAPTRRRDNWDTLVKTKKVLRDIHGVLRNTTGDANPEWMEISNDAGRILIILEHGSGEDADRSMVLNMLEKAVRILSKKNPSIRIEIDEAPF